MPEVRTDNSFDLGGTSPFWLAIGPAAAAALAAHGSEFLADGSPPIECVEDVHAALALLGRRRTLGCIVSAGVLDARPHAALQSLRGRVQPAPLLVHSTGTEDPSVRKAAQSLRIPVWEGGTAASARTATATAPAPTTKPAARPREAQSRSSRLPPEPGPAAPTAPRARTKPAPLPRADDDSPAPGSADPGRFAEGCLERIGRLRALEEYTLVTLSEVSNASRISLLRRESVRGTLLLRAGRGVRESLVGSVRCQLGTGIAGRVAALGRPVTGHGTPGGARNYQGTAYVVLPLGQGRKCEGVVCLTGLPDDKLPSAATLRTWTRLCRRAGSALRGARTLQRARALSTSDALTRLPNRRAFERALARELERARRGGTHLVVGILDVDHFKAFNDRYGHAVGDVVLREVARRLQFAFRETDLVTRWGGEEFAVLLPGLDESNRDEPTRLMERARQTVRARPFALSEGIAAARVTVSGGFAVYPRDAGRAESLLKKADDALYAAKDAGRDRIQSA